jgi:transposase
VNSRKNARLGFTGRVCLVRRVQEDGWCVPEATAAFGVSVQTLWKWLRRYRAEGRAGLRDRSSRPHRSPRQVSALLERRIRHLRAHRRSGPQIADTLHLALSAVGDVLRRLGLGRLPALTPRPPIVRYERERPGELLHIDAKTLGRIVGGVGHRITGDRSRRAQTRGGGWECLHVAIDDASRVAYAELLPDETAASAVVFLEHAVAWLATLGVQVEAG